MAQNRNSQGQGPKQRQLRVGELIRRVKPAAVLIEGPSDFNARFGELYLPHRLPVAVYSYVRLPDNRRRGAYHRHPAGAEHRDKHQPIRHLACPVDFVSRHKGLFVLERGAPVVDGARGPDMLLVSHNAPAARPRA